MNTFQLEKIFEGRKGFAGVFPIDQVPYNLKHQRRSQKCAIINLDPSWKPGSHWVSLCIKNKKLEYFDSYGLPPTHLPWGKEVKVRFNTKRYQGWGEITCGQFAIYFANEKLKGKSFKSILQILDRQKNADKFVVKYVKKTFPNHYFISRKGKSNQCCTPQNPLDTVAKTR